MDLTFPLKRINRKIIPAPIRHNLYHFWVRLENKWRRLMFLPILAFNYAYDCKRLLRGSSVNNKANTQTKLQALITMDYHRIEKGLALKEPRVGFGHDVVQRLLSNVIQYQKKYGSDETAQISLNALFAYYNFNLEHGLKDDQLYEALIKLRDIISTHSSTTHQGGVIAVTKKSILETGRLFG